MKQRKRNRFLLILKGIYTPKYIALNIAAAFVYYFALTYLISIQELGAVIIIVPIYLIYTLTISASVAFTISIFSIRNTRNNSAKVSASVTGTATTLAGGVITGCGCASPLLFSFTAIGVTTTQLFTLNNFISANQPLLLLAMIGINLFVVIYYINKLSKPTCKIKR